MVRKLTRLRIDEVSCCMRGAGRGTKVLIRKGHAPRHIADISKQRKAPTIMDRADKLRSIAKDFGLQKFAKFIAAENQSHGISEMEMFQLIKAESEKLRQPGQTSEQAFAKYFSASENVDLRRAVQVCKGMPVAKASGGLYEQEEDDREGDGDPRGAVKPGKKKTTKAEAIAEIEKLAKGLRQREPHLSEAQAFAKVFSDPANIALASVAHQRPSATR